MNNDSHKIFEGYAERLAEATGAPSPLNPRQQQPAGQPAQPAQPAQQGAQPAGQPAGQQAGGEQLTQTDILAGIIANGDEEFLKQLFAIPAVAQLMQSKMQQAPAQPEQPAQQGTQATQRAHGVEGPTDQLPPEQQP